MSTKKGIPASPFNQGLFTAGISAGGSGNHDEPIAVYGLPAAKKFPNGKIKESDCKTKDGRVIYEVEGSEHGIERIVSVREKGTVFSITKDKNQKGKPRQAARR